jgi:hypothetical protein
MVGAGWIDLARCKMNSQCVCRLRDGDKVEKDEHDGGYGSAKRQEHRYLLD